jgi:hypothetical protein
VTPLELITVARDAYGAATSTTTAGHTAPAEVTATPAVILRPADPWIIPNRRIGMCAEVRWVLQLVGGRFDLTASLGQLAAGYVAVVAALRGAGVGQVGGLGLVEPTEVAGVAMLAANFAVTIPYDPGAP